MLDHFVIVTTYIKPLRAAPHFVLTHHYKYSHSGLPPYMLILVSLTHGHMNILACKHAVYSVYPRVRGLYIVNDHSD